MARAAIRDPLHVYHFDVLETDLATDREARFPELVPPPGVRMEIFEDVTAPELRDVLYPDRLRLLPERARRGDVCMVAHVEDQVAGWLFFSRVSHRDPWSGLHVRLASDERYGYDLWIKSRYRRSGVGLYLAKMGFRWVSMWGDPVWMYFTVDRENVASQNLVREALYARDIGKVSWARVGDRWGMVVPFSTRPRYGPFSRRGRHSEHT